MSHTTVFVTDQAKAYDFYINKLGFKVATDVIVGGGDCGEGEASPASYRWLTISPPDQPELEIILMPAVGLPPEADKAIRLLLDMGLMGAGVFNTNDCRATYEELKAKGVEFRSEPQDRSYGVECILTDGCGNWFSMTERKEGTTFA